VYNERGLRREGPGTASRQKKKEPENRVVPETKSLRNAVGFTAQQRDQRERSPNQRRESTNTFGDTRKCIAKLAPRLQRKMGRQKNMGNPPRALSGKGPQKEKEKG